MSGRYSQPPAKSGGKTAACLMLATALSFLWLFRDEALTGLDDIVVYVENLIIEEMDFNHENMMAHVMAASVKYDLEPALIMAVIKAESAFNPKAVSHAGAQGLMQLMPGTARDMGCRNPFDPRQNIMGGSRYLRLMLDRFGGDVSLALAAYNAGPGRVARHGGIPNIAETKSYVKIVMNNYKKYQRQFPTST
ncbi:hypothetical protein C4J81_09360 [Deltaproteobacteria bacterium Smac51]|nr:hypothetical protein C4J81_09360 [Deltaproteobacteria bacterium Smac51]